MLKINCMKYSMKIKRIMYLLKLEYPKINIESYYKFEILLY